MDVICKNGKHFRTFQVAKECANNHIGGCGECKGIDGYFLPENKYTSANKQESDANKQNNTTQQPKNNENKSQCPLNKTQVFPCPRCCYSKSITERKKFLNATTWWFCKYPYVVNLSMLQPEDI